jgi:hypothetical protein
MVDFVPVCRVTEGTISPSKDDVMFEILVKFNSNGITDKVHVVLFILCQGLMVSSVTASVTKGECGTQKLLKKLPFIGKLLMVPLVVHFNQFRGGNAFSDFVLSKTLL